MIIYQNGRYIQEEEARISPFDHGFLYGMGLFETIRIYNGHPFLLGDHLLRLNDGMQEMHIESTICQNMMLDILHQLLKRNDLDNARVRINVSAGEGAVSLPSESYKQPNLMVFISPLQPASEEIMEKQATILKLNRNTPETTSRLKSHHFFNNIAAKRELRDQPNLEGIFLTKEGFVSEAITSNIFWIKNDILYTPELSTGILPGITRQFVILLAKQMGLLVKEGSFQLEELVEADEIFITNSIQELVLITNIDHYSFSNRSKPTVTKKLYEKYKDYREKLWTSEILIR
ncbi:MULTISPECIES: aminodeoxychorismate lyase [Bacillus]|uniref:aminodeoxychorismate lyase n=1 Tax=Bacillus TaxID=1386 RepID=UPI0002EE4852|nr:MULTISPECIES: aminodeoxychorismate lyase [Bacillus]